MEPLEWIALIGGILSLFGVGVDIWQTNKANKQQMEHDQAMAALNHRYREEEAQTSFEREANFNQFADANAKMIQAGISPSLMYGGTNMASPTPSVSSVGSSQGAGNVGKKFNISDFLGKLDPGEYASQTIERMNAKTMAEKVRSEVLKNNQDVFESLSRQAENERNTAFKRSMESLERANAQQALKNLEITGRTLDFDLGYKQETKPLQMQKLQLENDELIKKIDYTAEQIKTNRVQRAYLAKEIDAVDAGIKQTGANTKLIEENLKNGQLGRIMQEFGINARSVNLGVQSLQNLRPGMIERLKSASLVLQECGFSAEEADKAVLYYVATDKKDVTPSALNGLSRIISSGLK